MYKRRSAILILIFLLIIPIPVFANEHFITSSENWLDGWTYRKICNITGSSGAGTDYQVMVKAHYSEVFSPSLNYSTNWADKAHQGVATDGIYVYTTNSTMISKYQKDGTFIDSKDTTPDRTYSAIGDLCYYGNYLYVVDHNGGHPAHQKAMQYLASDLSYVATHDLEDYYSDDSGSANIAYGNGYFWTLSDWISPDTSFEVHRYSLSWTYEENWTVEAFSISGDYRYQGFDWIGEDYIITVPHEGATDYIDFYYFDGLAFSQYTRLERPEWTGEDSSTYEACQGVAVEIDGGTTYVWFASRNNTALTQQGEVGKYILTTSGDDNEVGLNGKCQADFDDVRFTDNDGITLLDHWRESYTVSDSATFWIQVQDSLSVDAAIYIYYGNSEVSTASNGDDTFDMFSDFSRHMDLDSWERYDDDEAYVYANDIAEIGSIDTVGKCEGLVYHGEFYYISTYSSSALEGWIYKINNDFEITDSLQVTDETLAHPGGMCYYKGYLYVPLAEPTEPQGWPSKINKYHAETLTFVETVITSSDYDNEHWGGVIIVGSLDRMYVANWDSEEIYVFEIDGTYITTQTDTDETWHIQDMVYIEQDGLIYGSNQYGADRNMISVWRPDGSGLIKAGEILTEDDRTSNGFTWYNDSFYVCQQPGPDEDNYFTQLEGANLALKIEANYVFNSTNIGPNIMIEARLKMGGNRRFNLGFVQTLPDTGIIVQYHNFDGDCYFYEGNDDVDCDFDFGSDIWITLGLGWIEDYCKLFKNRGSVKAINDGDITATSLKPRIKLWGTADAPIYCSWILIRNWVYSEPDSVWSGITEVFSLLTPSVLWSIDVAFIFIGIIMIPASTLFLVRGGKDDMDTDKIFYFLIFFLVGVGLIIGGITP